MHKHQGYLRAGIVRGSFAIATIGLAMTLGSAGASAAVPFTAPLARTGVNDPTWIIVGMIVLIVLGVGLIVFRLFLRRRAHGKNNEQSELNDLFNDTEAPS